MGLPRHRDSDQGAPAGLYRIREPAEEDVLGLAVTVAIDETTHD
jgi:hypothetical protein